MTENKTETFEEKMQSLEKIVKQLDEDEVSLEESLKLYQRGVELSSECDKILIHPHRPSGSVILL